MIGVDTKVAVTTPVCANCNGAGEDPNHDSTCVRCAGTGWEPLDE